jgi:adenine/guanine phosphoribosyltransferase-like PRPP-binding protein
MEQGFPPKESVTTKKELPHDMEELSHLSENIMQQIGSGFEKGNYGVIVGVDASGRLPTLLFSRVAKALAPQDRQPQALFVAGGETFSKEGMDNLKTLIHKGQKVLIVDDTLYSGTGLSNLCASFQKERIDYDIAVLVLNSRRDKIFLKNPANTSVFFGQHGRPYVDDPSLHGDYNKAGVHKMRGKEHAQPMKDYSVHPSVRPMKEISEARDDIAEIAENLVSQYKLNSLK